MYDNNRTKDRRQEMKIYCYTICKIIIFEVDYIKLKMHIGIPHFIVLCFIALLRHCVFYRLKVCGNPTLSKSIGTIFLTAFAHFMSLCHILVTFAIYQSTSKKIMIF